jgi:hypothetical protein
MSTYVALGPSLKYFGLISIVDHPSWLFYVTSMQSDNEIKG